VDKFTDPAAERGLLSGILNHGYQAYIEVKDLGCTVDSLNDPAAQALMACFDHLLKDAPGAQPDVATVYSAAQSLGLEGLLGGKDGIQYVRAVKNFTIDLTNVRPLAAKVRKLEVARSLDSQLARAQEELGGLTGDEPIEEILNIAESRIMDFAAKLDTGRSGPRPMHQGAREYITGLMDNPREAAGIPSGFLRWDEAIGGGLRPNSVDVWGARLKTGKTFAVDAVAQHVAGVTGLPVFNLDTEMTQEEHLHRVIAGMSGVPIREIETGKCGRDSLWRGRVEEALTRLEGMPYDYECVAGKSADGILASIRRWLFTRVGFDDNGYAKPCVVIYDYLKLTGAGEMSKNIAEYQAMGFIMTALKNLMAKYRAACLAFVQLNREGIDRDDSGAIAQSDRIGWLCTSFSILRKKTPDEIAESPPGPKGERYTHMLRPIDLRHGPGLEAGDYINIHTQYHIGRMEEGPRYFELKAGGGGGQPKGFVVEGHDDDDHKIEFNEQPF
jgi:replicative DNA helicase